MKTQIPTILIILVITTRVPVSRKWIHPLVFAFPCKVYRKVYKHLRFQLRGCFYMRVQHYFQPFLHEAYCNGRNHKTIKEMERMVEIFHCIKTVEVKSLSLRHVQRIRECAQRHGKYGECEAIKYFRKFLRFIDKFEPVPIDWTEIRLPRPPKKAVEYLTHCDIERIRAGLPMTVEGIRTRAMMELAIATGLRVGELCSLDQASLDLESQTLTVKNIKTGEINDLVFTEQAKFWISRYLESRPENDTDPALFVSQHQGRLKTVTARASLTKFEKQIKLGKPIYWHLFRKTFVTTLIQAHMDVKEVQTLARHSAPETTIRFYTGLCEEDAKRKQIEILERI